MSPNPQYQVLMNKLRLTNNEQVERDAKTNKQQVANSSQI